MTTDRERAWDELHAATPPGWFVGRPSHHPEREKWIMYAYDSSERQKVGLCEREWEVEGPTEEYVVRVRDGAVPARDTREAGAEVDQPGRRTADAIAFLSPFPWAQA